MYTFSLNDSSPSDSISTFTKSSDTYSDTFFKSHNISLVDFSQIKEGFFSNITCRQVTAQVFCVNA